MKDYLQPAATFALALAIASLPFTLPAMARGYIPEQFVHITNADEAITDIVLTKYSFPEWTEENDQGYLDAAAIDILAIDPDNVGVSGVVEVYTGINESGYGSYYLTQNDILPNSDHLHLRHYLHYQFYFLSIPNLVENLHL